MKAIVLAAAMFSSLPAAAQTARPNPLRPAQPSAQVPVAATPALSPEPGHTAKPAMDGAARRTECSRRYQAAKASDTLAGVKWPAFYSACNKALKNAG